MNTFPEWALKHKRKGTELRCLNGKYYLYEVTSKWNQEKKRSQKITIKLLGRITERDGFIESDKIRLERQNVIKQIVVKENGFASFYKEKLQEYETLLKKHFPDEWQTIVGVAYNRLVFQSALKNMDFHFQNSYMSQKYKRSTLSENSLSSFLRNLGLKRERIVDFCKEYNKLSNCILFDGSDICSQSEHMSLPKEGRCKRGSYESVINMMFVFSVDQHLPIYYRILPGNIKDVKSFKNSLEESGVREAMVIMDKGFYSAKNLKTIEESGLEFVIPLKRNNGEIDYAPIEQGNKKVFDGYFKFENRYIWYYKSAISEKTVWIFLDEELKNRESKDYLTRIEEELEDYTMEQYLEREHRFGTIALLHNTLKTAEEVYIAYKSRGEIEQMIDVYKNVLEADVSHMQNEHSLEGWMFCNFIALHWYYVIYRNLVVAKLLNKYSPQDFVKFLVEIKKVRINDKWYNAEITKKTQDILMKIGLPIT